MFAELGVIDQLVLMFLLLSSIIVGIRAGRARRVPMNICWGRSLPWWAILGSIVATETAQPRC